mmetsp:Transcript_32981/g.78645  ORF Transcript_32981/g.78645 Transcript_32981/m.78645 type:complete len:676 (-) Transcript_32981:191-2218(-)
MKVVLLLLTFFLASTLAQEGPAVVQCEGASENEICRCAVGSCADPECACDEAQACCADSGAQQPVEYTVFCGGQSSVCNCQDHCTEFGDSLCSCDAAQSCCSRSGGDYYSGDEDEDSYDYDDGYYTPSGDVMCPRNDEPCDCDADCAGVIEEIEFLVACGEKGCSPEEMENMPASDSPCSCGLGMDCCGDQISGALLNCPSGLVGEGTACLPTCRNPEAVEDCLMNSFDDGEEESGDFCSFVQNNLLDIQSCFDQNGCCADWGATVTMYKTSPVFGGEMENCVLTDQCPDLSTPGCGAQFNAGGVSLTSAAGESQACPTGELIVTFKNTTGERFCTGLKLEAEACANTAGWEYECVSDDAATSTICPNEFAAVQRLCTARDAAIVVAANVERIVNSESGNLDYPLTRENYQRMAGFLGLAAAWSKFDHDSMPVLRVEVKDAPSDAEQWLCGGEPEGAYLVLSSGPAASVVIPFVYMALSTVLTMAGESLVNVGLAFRNRDWLAMGLVGLDGASEVIGGSLFVSGLKSSLITNGKTIDQCTISGRFDGRDFKFGQGCGGLESMRTLGLNLPGMCTESTTLTVTGLVMGLVDIFIGIVIIFIYGLKRLRDRRAAALMPPEADVGPGAAMHEADMKRSGDVSSSSGAQDAPAPPQIFATTGMVHGAGAGSGGPAAAHP